MLVKSDVRLPLTFAFVIGGCLLGFALFVKYYSAAPGISSSVYRGRLTADIALFAPSPPQVLASDMPAIALAAHGLLISLMLDPTRRFSNRVPNYLKYRPRYPPAIIALLELECGLSPSLLIAEPGIGTGLLTELFWKTATRCFWHRAQRGNARSGPKERWQVHPEVLQYQCDAEATRLPNQSSISSWPRPGFPLVRPRERPEGVQPDSKTSRWVVLIWNGFFRVESKPPMAAIRSWFWANTALITWK